MKTRAWLSIAALVTFGLVVADFTDAQGGRGGGGRGGGRGGQEGGRGGTTPGGRSAAVQSRLNVSFAPVTGSSSAQPEGEADDLASLREVKEAAAKGQLTLLYLFSSAAGKRVQKFEKALFANESLAVALKAYRSLKLDLARDEIARSRHGKEAPLFVTFDTRGKRQGQVRLGGYKSSPGALLKLLTRSARGHGKLALPAFVKRYRTFLNELDKLDARKKTLAAKRARLGDAPPRSRTRKLAKERAALARTEKKLLDTEKKLLAAVQAPGTVQARAAAPRH